LIRLNVTLYRLPAGSGIARRKTLVESACAIFNTLRRGIPNVSPPAIPAPATVHDRELRLGGYQT
jgi:hypothetical protein